MQNLRKPLVRFCRGNLSQQRLSQISKILLVLMLLPLVIVAMYNYPADDDFVFTLPAATAWVQTHSVASVWQAMVDFTHQKYMDWQGDFVSTFCFQLNPLVFNLDLYFISNWFLLALLCLSAGYLLRGVTKFYLHAEPSVFWIAYTAMMILLLQFMPDIGYSVYWFNGGQYTVAVCVFMLLLGLLLRCSQPQSKARSLFRGGMLAMSGFFVGGCFFGPALGAFVLLALVTAVSLLQKSRIRWHSLTALLFFALSFTISILAPGNTLRQGVTGETTSILGTLATTVTDSCDLIGQWITPQLLAALLLIVPVFWLPLKQSRHTFRHPLGVTVMLYGLFAASLTPGIYTGFGYTTERYLNAVYFYFILAALGTVLYAEGALIRRLELRDNHSVLQAAKTLGTRFSTIYLAICLALFVFGGCAQTLMNRPSINAAKVLVTGEAAQWHSEMKARQEYLRVTDSDTVTVDPLSLDIPIFKYDRLPFQGQYGRVRYMKWYFELFYNAQQNK